MRLKILITTLTLLCTVLFTYSQNTTNITGRVISSTEKLPIPYVSITLTGKNIGTVTNDDGKFTLIAPISSTDSLSVSYIGYKPQRISLGGNTNRNDIIIKLDTLMQQLKEVAIRPLTTKQLLDSIVRHNQQAFLTPVKMNGYYREFVYTSGKCTEYSDALCSYFSDTNKPDDSQLKIIASRCAQAKADKNAPNREYYVDSKIPPNIAFKYALLLPMIAKYFPIDDLASYDYNIEQSAEKGADWIITIFPKPAAADKIYRVVFNLSTDFTLRSYRLGISPDRLAVAPQKNLLGIHGKLTSLNFEIDYERLGTKIYPKFFKIGYSKHLFGKLLGQVVEQTNDFKSEYVTTDINTTNLQPFAHGEVYKKGNICGNGAAMNDALLKGHNFIAPAKKDSLAISGLN